MEDFKVMECSKCGAMLLYLKECKCALCNQCCDSPLVNVSEGNSEKNSTHVPSYYRQDNKVIIRVNHEQEVDHFIEAIIIKTDNELLVHKFSYLEEPELIIGYESNMEIYSLCNKDGLFKTTVN